MFVDITPLDTIFVRDSRSFGVNEAHAVDSLFPPPPSAVFGAMRGAMLVNGGYEVCKWGGGLTQGKPWPKWFDDSDSEDGDRLRQEGPVVRIGETPLFPMPLDVWHSDGMLGLVPIKATPKNMCGISLPFCFHHPKALGSKKEEGSMYISAGLLSEYLDLADPKQTLTNVSKRIFATEDLWAFERRVNVSLDPCARAGKEGALFSLEHARTDAHRHVGLTSRWRGPAEFGDAIRNGFSSGNAMIVNLGGERRLAAVRENTGFSWPVSNFVKKPSNTEKTCFRLYFATPAYFENGWKPAQDNAGRVLIRTDETGPDGIPATLLAAAVGKYRCIGGYDFKRQKERSMHRFVPEGSVYYLETDAENAEKVTSLNGQTVGDNPYFRARGYGLAFVGVRK